MIEIGCHGFQETDTDLLCYFDITQWSKPKFIQFQADIRKLLRNMSTNADIRMRTIEEENWNEQWEQTVQPIEIGEKIVVKPSWASYENTSGRTIIHIDPKMSFGTGYHETTRLTIQLLERYVQHNTTMLDVGTGTGILAIAAVKLGVASAMGIDIDEWSVKNAAENAMANNVSHRVKISQQTLEMLPQTEFDLIAANITLNTIITLLPEMNKRLKKNGTLLLSGLLESDEHILTAALSHRDFKVVEKIFENEWIAVAARRGGDGSQE